MHKEGRVLEHTVNTPATRKELRKTENGTQKGTAETLGSIPLLVVWSIRSDRTVQTPQGQTTHPHTLRLGVKEGS